MNQHKDLYIFDCCTPDSLDNLNSLCTLVYRKEVFLWNWARKNILLARLSRDRYYWIHRVKDYRDLRGLKLMILKKKESLNFISIIQSTNRHIPLLGRQERKAFPVIPGKQLHIGIWLYTLHCAFSPQVPGHGSTHLLRMQARDKGQSLLRMHSGRQPI